MMREKIIAALIIAGLLYVAIDGRLKNKQLKDRIDEIATKVEKVEKTNQVNNNYYYTEKTKDQQLIKDAGRSQLLFDKPGLVEIKINNSYNEYMENFNK